jgi:hypothetical protein
MSSKFLLFCSCVICKQELSVQNLSRHLVKHIIIKKPTSHCLLCNEPIFDKRQKFCCLSHSATYTNRLKGKKQHSQEPNYCLCCGIEIAIYTDYCGHKCLWETKNKEYIKDWLDDLVPIEKTYSGVNNTLTPIIRRYLIEKAENKCQKCGWCEVNPKTGLVPIQINHIDGDSTNTRPENLEVICPNCHALTENFGGLNRGKGRKKRYAEVAQRLCAGLPSQ